MVIDAFAFCRGGERQSGRFSLVELGRLRSECASSEDGDGVEWELTGTAHSSGYPMLQLSIRGTVHLLCQRCLAPFVFQIHSETNLILAADEAKADELDATLEEEEIEVIAGSRTFDIVSLIEDEALLAIPLSPKHEVCPKDKSSAEKLDAFAKAKKESPFAAIKDQIMFGDARGKTKN